VVSGRVESGHGRYCWVSSWVGMDVSVFGGVGSRRVWSDWVEGIVCWDGGS